MRKKLFVIGVFLSKKNQHKIYRTAADQLAEMLTKNSWKVFKASTQTNNVKRFADTFFRLVLHIFSYRIVLIPLLGGKKSLMFAYAISLFNKLFKKKSILIIHGGSVPGLINQNPAPYLKLFAKQNAIVCPSAFIHNALKTHAVNSTIIPNVLDLSNYPFQHKNDFSSCLLWMRTFEAPYNPLMAVRVLYLVRQHIASATLIMAGHDVDLLNQTKHLANQLNVLEFIHFPGYISLEEKIRLVNQCGLYLCTNTIDNAPVSVIEMMALGLPVISTNVGGLPYLIQNNHNGFLVEDDNAEQMASSIVQLLQQPAKLKEVAKNAFEYAQEFDAPNVYKKWESLFYSLSQKQLN